MKKLLSVLAVSTLVGTSASNLKPLFTSNVNDGFKSNQVDKAVSITNENNTNPFITMKISDIKLINTITVSPKDGTIWVGTQGNGLYKSTDGINFIPVNNMIKKIIYSVATSPDGTIYVGTSDGLYTSGDGLNFKINNNFPPYNYIKSFAIDNNGYIYVATVNGVLKSENGVDFEQMGGIPTNFSMNSITVSPKDGTIWVGGWGGVVYCSNGSFDFAPIQVNKDFIYCLSIDKNSTIWIGTRQGLYKSTDGINFIPVNNMIKKIIYSVATSPDGTIYVGTYDNGLYKSTDGINFEQQNANTGTINCISTDKDGTIYVGTHDNGIYAINLINQLLKINKPDTFDNSWPKYKGIVYNSEQKIDIKEQYLKSAKLDNKNLTIPTTDLDLTNGQHTLVLTLKEEYKDSAVLFGGDNNTGQITYKLWVKTSIDKKGINYSTNTDDTDLTDLSLGFVSTTGNTINCPIIQTKSKDGSVHNDPLNISYDDALIDYSNSYYVQGTVDTATNDFNVTGQEKKITKNLLINTDGTYHLHLLDIVGNTYDSYLELGASNWKLHGTFDDSELNQLKNELNVTVNLTDPQQLSIATGWLTKYEQIVNGSFAKSLQTNGKGFDSEIKNDLPSDFKWFLNPLTYETNNEPKFDDGIDKDKLDKTIRDTAEKCLQDGLTDLQQNLNIDFKNVTDKQMLDNCKIWSNNYEKYIKDNVSKWITDISNVASRGFATSDQFDQIKSYINGLPFNKYLKRVEWTPNLTASGYDDKYLQYVELDKLQSDAINWVNQHIPQIDELYQQAIKNAESGLNLHGYSIDTLLNHKSIPQTKSEIDNFADGQSFHNWLQSQANIKFHGWQLAMGLGIGIPLFLLVAAITWVIRSRTNPKYNGVARAKKNLRQDKKNLQKLKKT